MYVFSQRKTPFQHPTVRRKPTRFRVRICRTFSPCPHVRLRLQRTHCFISRWAVSTARVYTRKNPYTSFFQDMYGVFRLMFLSNCPSARAKSKIFSTDYIITRNLSCKVFLSLPAFCSYSHTKIPCQGISYHRRRFRRERQPIRTLQSYLILLFPDVLVRHRG